MLKHARLTSPASLTIFLTIVYFVSYITRLNYSTVMVELIGTLLTKDEAALPLTGTAIAYGVGQLLSGYAADRWQPKIIVGIGLLFIAAMNLLLPFCTTPGQMLAVWSVNGVAQAFMWPPMIRLMSAEMSQREYNRACVAVTIGGNGGHVLLFLTAPALISLGDWKTVFYVSSALALAMLGAWAVCCPVIERSADETKKETEKKRFPWSVMLIAMLAAILCMGALRDGVTSWTPTIISETFGLGAGVSMVSGVILPVFAILSIAVTAEIQRRFVRNELTLAAILFGICAAAAALMGLSMEASPFVTLALVAVIVSTMHGVNLMLISLVPRYYLKTGAVSLVSGVINSFTYVGAALSAQFVAAGAEGWGWTTVIFAWAGIALAGCVLCLWQQKPWARFSA